MKTIITFLLILTAGLINAQDNSLRLFKINASKSSDRNAEYRNSVDDAVIIDIDKEMYQSITRQRDHNVNLTIPVSQHENKYAVLERFEILTPDARFVERSSTGERDLDLRNITLSYKGKIAGDDNSLVVITFYNGRLVGLIQTGYDKYVIGALRDRNNNETDDHIIFLERKLKTERNFKCGSDQFGVPDDILRKMSEFDGNHSDHLTNTMYSAKVAVDVDFYTYGVYGSSVPNATAYAMAIMTSVSAVYVKDENVKLNISYLRVWTTQDPYTSTSGSSMLNQFRNEWVANQGGVERAIAHLISRRNNIDVAGIAYLNVLCNPNLGYGLSATLTGVINQLPSYSYDVETVAHEIGHNFGSPHTHNCGWVGGPIDTCSDVEGGCYNGPLHGTVGTIMSYCDISAGGSVIMDFGEQPGALIRNYSENAACLTVYERPVYAAFPNGGETFKTLTSTKIFWGSSLSGNVNIELTTDNGASWTSIQNNVPAQQREIAWTVPYIGYTNQAKIRVLESGNPSIGDTSDAAFRIVLSYTPFELASPPNNTRILTNSISTEVQKFVWKNAGTHPSLRYKFKIRKLGAGGVDYIYNSDNAGADTVLSLRKSFLDSLALAIGTVNDSVKCSWRSWVYNGYDSLSSSNTFIVTLARTNVGINVISSVVPDRFDLKNNYPNPFNPSTKIKFDVSKFQNVRISVYDITGRIMETLVNESLQPGSYEATFNGANYSSGVYYYKMEAKDFVMTRKMLLVK